VISGQLRFLRRYRTRRIARLLRIYHPSILVLRGAGSRYPRNMKIRRAVARIARDHAKNASVPSACVSERSFKSFFNQYSCHDKYDIAVAISKWYPELAWRVPQALKFYDPEPSQMLYFDSIALASAYLAVSNKIQLGNSENGNPFTGLQVT